MGTYRSGPACRHTPHIGKLEDGCMDVGGDTLKAQRYIHGYMCAPMGPQGTGQL